MGLTFSESGGQLDYSLCSYATLSCCPLGSSDESGVIEWLRY
jgi:hypothetical protein